ncbi:MAG TPA: cephalosporin hydroxylase family protein [Flavitalea sp.]|nr:cephalosporin hydroxylase family protein [Flavitalea sp.]
MSDIKTNEKMTDPIRQFHEEKENRIDSYGTNHALRDAATQFNVQSNKAQYSYNFSWMGRPIIQYPQDMIAMQEIIWQLKPDLIIETGIAHGGSLIYYASIMELIGKGEIVGIDIEIREHNRKEIENHPMYKRIKMVEGSSISQDTVDAVKKLVSGKKTVLVSLDSNHTHEHVLSELNLYSPFVTPGSYIVVFDTIVEDMPDNYLPGRAWSRGDNPKTAVWEFLKQNPDFEIDHAIDNKLLISVAPEGYLKRIR